MIGVALQPLQPSLQPWNMSCTMAEITGLLVASCWARVAPG